jgi:hypothetical protein
MAISINKNSSYVLLHLLQGRNTATIISEHMPGVDVRSVQRGLNRLTELGVTIKNGTNHPTYSVNYRTLLRVAIADKLLENEERPETTFNFGLIDWLNSLNGDELDAVFAPDGLAAGLNHEEAMTAKELEHLTIELSWKSSALEGNTYTLLDTQLLLVEGVKAKNRTEFETQMILNHKNAITFIVENKELFKGKLAFSTLEELHRIIGYNLGIDKGIRKKLVRITASNYTPIANPQQLRECADATLATISRAQNPYARALLALGLVPYLQVFEDGNKRTGRMLANALLIASIGVGFSLRKVSPRQLALAYLSFYEFNSIASLSKILKAELT